MRRLGVGLLLVASVAACLQPAGRLFSTELSSSEGDPLPIELRDETGLVSGIEPEPFDPEAWAYRIDPLAQADPSDGNAFVITWVGGACMKDAELSFRPSQGGYALHLTGRGGSGNCPALAIPRGLRILTSSPISVGSIVVSGGG